MQGLHKVALAALLGWHGSAAGAPPLVPETPRFEVFGEDEGLPSSFLASMVQDRESRLWIGSRDGLIRYDGVEFKVFRHDPSDAGSLRGNTTTLLHLDDRSRLWIGVEGEGLSRRDPGHDAFIHFDRETIPVLRSDVYAGESTADGSTWFGTMSDGLYRVDARGKWSRFAAEDGLDSLEVLALARSRDGGLWIGTGKGLRKWDGHSVRPLAGDPLLRSRVVTLLEDDTGLWVGSQDGFFLVDSRGVVTIPEWTDRLPHPMVVQHYKDSLGQRWLSTRKGLVRERSGQLDMPAGAHPGHFYGLSVLEDREGGLWFLRAGTGLMHQRANSRQFAAFPPGEGASGTSAQVVWGLGLTKGGAWIVGSGGGLDRYDAATGTIQKILRREELPVCNHASVAEAPDGAVWIGCPDHLARWTRTAGAVERWTASSSVDAVPTGSIDSIAVDRRGLIWSGSQGSAIQARTVDGQLAHHVARTEGIEQLSVGPDESMWLAGELGLQRWNPDSGDFEHVPGAPRSEVFAFAVQSTRVWLHTLDTLSAYDWNGRALILRERVGAADGLPIVESGGLLVDGSGKVLLTTARGLVTYDPALRRVRTFGIADGLPSQEFMGLAPVMVENGVVLASTAGGLVAFDPASIVQRKSTAEIRAHSISVRRQDSITQFPLASKSIVLEPGDRDLRVTFRMASLAEARSRRYRIRLDGYDTQWVEDAEGERVFTRLEPGTYRLEVVGAVGSGDWSTPYGVDVIVKPAWWQTELAKALAALAAFLLLLLAAVVYRARVARINAMALAEERRRIAEHASAAKSRFLADLGHEIRTPMTGVLGMAELLGSDALEPQQRRRVAAIQAAGEHLLRLLNDALDLARIEAGKLDLQDAPFDLHQLLAGIGELLRPQAESKGLQFELVIEDDLPQGVRGDAGRVRQILLNLGHNAAKFTDEGKVSLRAGVHDGLIRITVADTGIGLDSDAQARLFARFEQADGARTWSLHGGSGLGLSICRQLVHAMQGRIEVESAPGAGARFTLELPLPTVDIPERRAQPRLQVREAGVGSAKILLVEDDLLVAQVVAEMLAAQGHTVHVAAHGLDALARAAGEPFDLVFLDLDLPGLDGIELARLWPEHAVPSPIVALTARADNEAEPQARAAGMVGFLRKPVSGEQLAGAVARHARMRTSPVEDRSDAEAVR